MKELTKAEEQIMQVIWRLKSCFIKEVVKELPEPKPAYNTVGTFLKILESKGYVTRENIGNVYSYSPAIERKDYSRKSFSNLLSKYFNNSPEKLLSFMMEEKELTVSQIESLLKRLKEDD